MTTYIRSGWCPPFVLSHSSIGDGPNRDQFQQNIKGHDDKVPSAFYNILHWHDAAKMEDNWKKKTHPDANFYFSSQTNSQLLKSCTAPTYNFIHFNISPRHNNVTTRTKAKLIILLSPYCISQSTMLSGLKEIGLILFSTWNFN